MARTLLVLEEAVAILETVGAPRKIVEAFRNQAFFALQHKARGRAPDGPTDAVTVSSGFGQASQRGFVELCINDTLSQMPPPKAREIGLMLLEAAEAAISDEIVVGLLVRIGITDQERQGRILLDLREIRQGTRGTSHPS